jgi:hypothetical protein
LSASENRGQKVKNKRHSKKRIRMRSYRIDQAGDQKMKMSPFTLFLDQRERFIESLLEYDPHLWFPPLRGPYREANPSNWFICFVPESWGHWEGAIYGVHFDFMYARPRGYLPERIRLAVGVETPMLDSQRQSFKEFVIARIKEKQISTSGFVLEAKARTKLLDSNPIPFNEESWRIALQRYISLQPVIETIAEVVRDFYSRAAFSVPMVFPD